MPQADSAKATGPTADALVIFGITGDLAKKMTLKALFDLWVNGTLKVPVIGVGRKRLERRRPPPACARSDHRTVAGAG